MAGHSAILPFDNYPSHRGSTYEEARAYADGLERAALWHESKAREIGWDFVEGRAHRSHAEEIRRLKP